MTGLDLVPIGLGIVIAIIGFFVKRLMTQFDKIAEKQQDNALMIAEIPKLRKDLDELEDKVAKDELMRAETRGEIAALLSEIKSTMATKSDMADLSQRLAVVESKLQKFD